MKLPRPFFRLPVRFDAARLRAEVESLPPSAWQEHPGKYAGNSAVRLITVGGEENDAVAGEMRATAHLQHLPYVRQVLGRFGVVWGRSRLMRLAPRSVVPEHADINYHWFNRVRVHIPVVTYPEVRFHCDGQSVHMAAGECWVFDNWRPHHVENPTAHDRIHLVADTTGTAAFWNLVLNSQSERFEQVLGPAPEFLGYDAGADATLLTERHNAAPVMPPTEVDFLTLDLRRELGTERDNPEGRAAVAAWHTYLANFCHEWRSLWSLYGDTQEGWPAFRQLCDRLRAALEAIGTPVLTMSNRMSALEVLHARVLHYAVHAPSARPAAEREYESRPSSAPRTIAAAAAAAPSGPIDPGVRRIFDRPIFIVAAPRSGSTLLFETLACSHSLWSLGDESHGIIEGHPSLRPGAPGVDSNRLGASAATPAIAASIAQQFADKMQNPLERARAPGEAVRFIEKTPKNALRIPFFDAIFPDARFVFLWRDPRDNISSIIDAWRSGNWVTYPRLAGWAGPWSLLLPPGWQALRGKPLEEVAACQWDRTNRQILDDLRALPRDRWMSLDYASFVQNPARAVRGICAFAGLPFDEGLSRRVAGPLPLSRYTHTPPDPEKWRRNRDEVERVLPSTAATLERLRALARDAVA